MMPPVVGRFLAAAQARDVVQMHRLVDWPLSGAARMTRALAHVEAAQRDELARQGLAELRRDEDRWHPLAYRLQKMALGLAHTPSGRPAGGNDHAVGNLEQATRRSI